MAFTTTGVHVYYRLTAYLVPSPIHPLSHLPPHAHPLQGKPQESRELSWAVYAGAWCLEEVLAQWSHKKYLKGMDKFTQQMLSIFKREMLENEQN